MVALLCILCFAFTAYDYFKAPPNGHFSKGNWAKCGNFKAVSNDDGNLNFLSLEIKDSGLGEFILSGELILNLETSKKLAQSSVKGMNVILQSLRSPYFFSGTGQSFDLDITNKVPYFDNRIAIKIIEKKIYSDRSSLDHFPFDQYLIGYRPTVSFFTIHEGFAEILEIDSAITNVRLSPLMTVSNADTWGEYVQGVKLEANEVSKKYQEDECVLIIKRSPWYIAMVALLVMLLFVPAIYLFYRPQDNPGIDLIAVILGIAAIRQFFLGSVVEWKLYPIDIVFAGIVVLTAVIPLFRLNKDSNN